MERNIKLILFHRVFFSGKINN